MYDTKTACKYMIQAYNYASKGKQIVQTTLWSMLKREIVEGI